jgi:hypothetical protein
LAKIDLPDDCSAFYLHFTSAGRWSATAYKFRSESCYHRQGENQAKVLEEILADLASGRSIRERNAESARAVAGQYSKPVDISSINLNELDLDL